MDEPGQAKGITLYYIYTFDTIEGLLCKLAAFPLSYIRVFQLWQRFRPEAVSDSAAAAAQVEAERGELYNRAAIKEFCSEVGSC